MHRLPDGGVALTILCLSSLFLPSGLASPAPATAADCLADPAWFLPAGPDPVDPNIALPPGTEECAFYKVAWQTLLNVTQPDRTGKPRFLSFVSPIDLFQNRAMTELAVKDHKKGSLNLLPRSLKTAQARTIDGVLQAVSEGVLVDQSGRAVYTSTQLNEVFVKYIKNQGFDTDVTKIAMSQGHENDVIDAGSLELKATWKIFDPTRDDAKTFFVIEEDVPDLAVKVDPATGKKEIVTDLTVPPRHKKLALVGLHVVLTVKDHPEFIWATFEHFRNAPGLAGQGIPHDEQGAPLDSAVDGSQDYTFYVAGTKRSECNKHPKLDDAVNPLVLDPTTQKLTPVTQVFRQFKYGGLDNSTSHTNEPDPDVTSLNKDVRAHLKAANSVWQNYFLLGAVWIDDPENKFVLKQNPFDDDVLKGESRLSNSTIETFTQPDTPTSPVRSNCLRCHITASETKMVNGQTLTLPAQKINVSHALKNAFFHQ